MARTDDPRRALPAVDSLLSHPAVAEASQRISPVLMTAIVREVLAAIRSQVKKGEAAPSADRVAAAVVGHIDKLLERSPRRVINATGVILHTGLGRAPLGAAAIQALQEAAGYCDLEFNLATGERGDRQARTESLLHHLTGAESALVVNNNAAAIYLTLNVLGYRREVVVSRGQLIEIGGSFRLPDIMARSGVKLVEVGTTNRTRLADYGAAIGPKTALLLRAHPSNYRIIGFTESVPLEALVALGKRHQIPVVDDIGNGLIRDWSEYGLPTETNARSSLGAGADLVLMSGDKVLGGPQAGIVLGRKELVERLKRSPLARVLRPEKLALAGLNATLRGHLKLDTVRRTVPTWEMLTAPLEELRRRAQNLKNQLAPLGDWQMLEVRDCESEAGSGTLPAVGLPSAAVVMLPVGSTANDWAKRLRSAQVPVISIVRQDLVWLDVRTVREDEMLLLVQSVASCLKGSGS